MKKHLFFAAFALSMMASCTSEDNLGVEQPTAPESDKVAIQLGIDAPTVTATGRAVSRGTGSVGDVASGNNSWNGQRLYIAMVDEDGNLAQQVIQDGAGNVEYDVDGTTPKMENILDWNKLDYYAPNTGSNGDIIINQTGSTTEQQYEYYPVNGKFDFYGWHVDDANIATPETNIKVAGGEAYIKNITIDGTQDIMGARTKEFNETNYPSTAEGKWTPELADWAFSARTARGKVKPILKFDHQLARLKFFVRAGSDGTGLTNANGDENKSAEGEDLAMYVTALSVEDMVNTIDMHLNATLADGSKGIQTVKTETTSAQDLVTFHLGSKGADGKVGTLTAVAPAKTYNKDDDATKGTQIGESIMFLPDGESKEKLTVNLSLKQKVIDTETAGNPDPAYTYIEKVQDAVLTVYASSLVGGADKEFKPGYSYNIYITVYGFERIEVTAELTAWEIGGDVDVDIEEGASKHDVDLAFNVSDSDGKDVTTTSTFEYVVDDVNLEDTDNRITVKSYSTVKYKISAAGCEPAEGYVNAEGGKTVNIVLKKDETQVPSTPTTSTINFEITLPEGKTEATITVVGLSETLTYSDTSKSLTLPYGEEEKTIQIKVDGYNVVTTTVTPNKENVTVTVEQDDFDAEVTVPTTQTVAFNIKLGGNPVADASLTVTYGDNQTQTVTSGADGTCTVELPDDIKTIKYTVAAKDGEYAEKAEDDVTLTGNTVDITLTAE